MSADDVSKLAAFALSPDIFQDIVAEQPAIMKFLSNPLRSSFGSGCGEMVWRSSE